MGYSKSIDTLNKRLHLLELLKQGKECEWPCDVKSEKALAYKIREALHIAGTIATEEYPKLADAYLNFTIRETGQGRVTATRKEISEPRPLTNTKVDKRTVDHSHKTEQLRVSRFYSLTQIISALKRVSPEQLPVHFPEVSLENDDLITLYNWTQKNTDYLIFWTGDSITIHKHSDELEALAFNPEDLLEETEK